MEGLLAMLQRLPSLAMLNQLAILHSMLQNVQDDVGEHRHMNCIFGIHIMHNIDIQVIL